MFVIVSLPPGSSEIQPLARPPRGHQQATSSHHQFLTILSSYSILITPSPIAILTSYLQVLAEAHSSYPSSNPPSTTSPTPSATPPSPTATTTPNNASPHLSPSHESAPLPAFLQGGEERHHNNTFYLPLHHTNHQLHLLYYYYNSNNNNTSNISYLLPMLPQHVCVFIRRHQLGIDASSRTVTLLPIGIWPFGGRASTTYQPT